MNASGLRIGFMGTPDFALAALKALVEAGENVVCVYSQPPRPKGRGQQVQPSPVHEYAQSRGIPVFTPTTLKDVQAQEVFAAHHLDVAIVAAYGLILPEAVLRAPKYGCLNIHGSILPRWRGAAPIQYAIWKGDTQTGVTIMQMEKGLDTGPMIAKKTIAITPDTTAISLYEDLAKIGADLALHVISELAENGQIRAEIQNDADATYAAMLKKTDSLIDWNIEAQAIDRQIRALNPWPGVWAQCNGQRVKILQVAVAPNLGNADVQAPAGTILDKAGSVVCANHTVLQLITVQPEGKKPMDVLSAYNGGYLGAGARFS